MNALPCGNVPSNESMGRPARKPVRQRRFEEFEQRLVMSADPVTALSVQPIDVTASLPNVPAEIISAEDFATDAAYAAGIADQYGFDGSGQTIAVIDSGIAWDHAAFGGGFGEGHRVVGGWDFAENDANPYDDGPAGFHGTHVAGIIGSEDPTYRGVASGADLVALRVFDDAGRGEIQWVESALQWVRDNLNTFENPITTVNLSLGIGADSPEASQWTILQDELEDLKDAGVFISVAAGNDFRNLQTTGLSFPAASEHVVPVASHNSFGTNGFEPGEYQLSEFSQRDSRVLVAPGSDVVSAAPDHLFGNFQRDSFVSASGTSQAAPYVAGASAILRQANAFVGNLDVDQETLYEQFLATSESIFDPVTNATYQRIDLQAAIESVVNDAHGDVPSQATDVGVLEGGELLRGTISDTNDADWFRLNTQGNGQVALEFQASHDLQPQVEIVDSEGNPVELRFDGNHVYFEAAEGEYFVGISASEGTGHFEVAVSWQAEVGVFDLGEIESIDVTDIVDTEKTYSLTASRSGPLALELSSARAATFEVFDGSMNRIAISQTGSGENAQIRLNVETGDELFIQVVGGGEVDLQIDNLVQVVGDRVLVFGTEGVDEFELSDGEQISVSVNGNEYRFDRSEIDSVEVRGDESEDTVEVHLSDRFERTVLRHNRVDAFDGRTSFRAVGFRDIDVYGSGGQLTVAGTRGDDTIAGDYQRLSIVGADGKATGHGFDIAIADGKGGHDRVQFFTANTNDTLFARGDRAAVWNGTSRLVSIGATELEINTRGGHDIVNLFGTQGADRFVVGEGLAGFTSESGSVFIRDAARVNSFAGQAADAIEIEGTGGADRLSLAHGVLDLRSESQHFVANGFAQMTVGGGGGQDTAVIRGTRGTDTVVGSEQRVDFGLDRSSLSAAEFERVSFVGRNEGNDRLQLVGGTGNESFQVDADSATLGFESGSFIRAVGIGVFDVDLGAGNDRTSILGSAGDDRLIVDNERVDFTGDNLSGVVRDAAVIGFDGGGGGRDGVYIDDAKSLDVVSSLGDRAIAFLNRQRVEIENIDYVEVTAVEQAIAQYDLESVDFETVLRGNWESK